MRHDTKYLRTFLSVCNEGGVGKAAGILHWTQPAVSYQIGALERDVGAALFERCGRRLILTAAGRRLREFSRRYLAEFDSICAGIVRGAQAQTEPLRVASVSGFGRYVLFPALNEMLASESAVALRLDLRFRTAAEVFRLVEEGDVDFGAVYLPKVSSYLAFAPLYREELVLIASPAIAQAAERSRDLGRISSYEALPLITYLEGDYVLGRWFQAIFGKQAGVVTSAHHFDELEEVIDTVIHGHGLSVVPLDAARSAVDSGDLCVLRPFRNRKCINQVFLVTRAGGFVRPEADALRLLIERAAAWR